MMPSHLKRTIARGIAIGLSAIVVGWLAVQAQQAPTQDPPGQFMGAPITPFEWQTKLGGLGLNLNVPNLLGLVVEKNAPGEGIVFIGPHLAQPAFSGEQLNLHGNLAISGVIEPTGDTGEDKDVLTRAAGKMIWKGPGWISIMGDFSADYNCSASAPLPCAAFGLEEYELFCMANSNYSAWLRICREP